MPAKTDDAKQGPTAKWLLELIEEFMTINGMDNDGNRFGWLFCGDRTLVQRLRDGGDITTTRMDDAIAFMRNPVNFYRRPTPTSSACKSQVIPTALKPLTIKPRSKL